MLLHSMQGDARVNRDFSRVGSQGRAADATRSAGFMLAYCPCVNALRTQPGHPFIDVPSVSLTQLASALASAGVPLEA